MALFPCSRVPPIRVKIFFILPIFQCQTRCLLHHCELWSTCDMREIGTSVDHLSHVQCMFCFRRVRFMTFLQRLHFIEFQRDNIHAHPSTFLNISHNSITLTLAVRLRVTTLVKRLSLVHSIPRPMHCGLFPGRLASRNIAGLTGLITVQEGVLACPFRDLCRRRRS